jgi:hypothetical protein
VTFSRGNSSSAANCLARRAAIFRIRNAGLPPSRHPAKAYTTKLRIDRIDFRHSSNTCSFSLAQHRLDIGHPAWLIGYQA